MAIHRQTGVTYKTAWRMLDLIKEMDKPGQKEVAKSSVGIYPAANGKYRARTKVGSKTINLGTFDSADEARAAYRDAKRILRTRERFATIKADKTIMVA